MTVLSECTIVTNDGFPRSFASSLLNSHNTCFAWSHPVTKEPFTPPTNRSFQMVDSGASCNFPSCLFFRFCLMAKIFLTCHEEKTASIQQHKVSWRHFQTSMKKNFCNSSKAAHTFQSFSMNLQTWWLWRKLSYNKEFWLNFFVI